jgi:integrase
VLRPTSSFAELADLWLADLELRDLAGNTKENYRTCLRLHVRPAFEHYTLAEVTTGRVEWFLAKQAKVSPSQAKQTRTLLNLLFGYALRHDAIARNPVEGTSQLRRAKATPQALTLDQIAAIRHAAATWRTEPGLPGPKPDGQVRDIVEVLLGTAMRPGEVLALRRCDIEDLPAGMIASVTGTVVQRKGSGAERQHRPKTDASIRRLPVPEFAAVVLRRRLADMPAGARHRTIFASRGGGPLSPYNVRRTFREFLSLAGLADTGISLRWYRRTGATVIARGIGTDAAAAFLGHTSTVITEGHYIEPDRVVDPTPAAHLERTLRPTEPDGSLLANRPADREDELLAAVDLESDDDAVA